MKETKINQNTKLLGDIELFITNSLGLVKELEKSNEFVNYWLCCYDSERFEAVDLFHPMVEDRSLRFEPSDLYDNNYRRGGKFCYEWSSASDSRNSKKINVPSQFNAGPIHLCLGHHDTDSRNALFIPTECLMSAHNRGLYETLKELSPKDSFPSKFYNDSLSLAYNRMRSEVSHAVVKYHVNQDGDSDISVRWYSDYKYRYSGDFYSLDSIFDHLWEGLEVYPYGY